ncbi:MAG: DUF427 domain-containing protein [Rhizobiales bacterium]|nr:DUF427 domain-containing protein [Hyphomicrobiales bacterium]
MPAIEHPAWLASQHRRFVVRPYEGTINVRFLDAILASTRDALVVDGDAENGDPIFFIPFSDIYFEFLTPSARKDSDVDLFDVTAAGRAEEAVMWSFSGSEDTVPEVWRHGAFDPRRVTIEEVPDEQRDMSVI